MEIYKNFLKGFNPHKKSIFPLLLLTFLSGVLTVSAPSIVIAQQSFQSFPDVTNSAERAAAKAGLDLYQKYPNSSIPISYNTTPNINKISIKATKENILQDLQNSPYQCAIVVIKSEACSSDMGGPLPARLCATTTSALQGMASAGLIKCKIYMNDPSDFIRSSPTKNLQGFEDAVASDWRFSFGPGASINIVSKNRTIVHTDAQSLNLYGDIFLKNKGNTPDLLAWIQKNSTGLTNKPLSEKERQELIDKILNRFLPPKPNTDSDKFVKSLLLMDKAIKVLSLNGVLYKKTDSGLEITVEDKEYHLNFLINHKMGQVQVFGQVCENSICRLIGPIVFNFADLNEGLGNIIGVNLSLKTPFVGPGYEPDPRNLPQSPQTFK